MTDFRIHSITISTRFEVTFILYNINACSAIAIKEEPTKK